MPSTLTPIRYPGGKTKIYPHVKKLMEKNGLLGGTYCEPFAGGAGLAIKLLLNNDVNEIVINDLDPAIYAMWYNILFRTDSLCHFIQTVELTISEWDRQKEIYLNPENHDIEALGNAALFLNRTNVSGVITGGVIGGRKQEGNYKMDARFNRETLVKKIKAIAKRRNQIELHNMDAIEFIKEMLPSLEKKSLVNFDPPYVKKVGTYIRTHTPKMTTASLEIISLYTKGFGLLRMIFVIWFLAYIAVIERK